MEPWWYVNLQDNYVIEYVVLFNRQTTQDRLEGAQVRVGTNTRRLKSNDACGKPVSYKDAMVPAGIIVVECENGTEGNIVSVQLENQTNFLTLCEVKIYGSLNNGKYCAEADLDILTTVVTVTDDITSPSSICIGEDQNVNGTTYSFPDVPLGTTANSIQDCPLYSNKGKNASLATRHCAGDVLTGAAWGFIIVTDCGIETTSSKIQILYETKVTENNSVAVANDLAYLTNNTEDLDEETVQLVAEILKDIVNLELPDENITLDVVEVVDNIIDSGVFDSETSMRETASSFVTSLERQLATMAVEGINFTSVQPHVGVMTLAINTASLVNDLAYVSISDGDSLKTLFEADNINAHYEKTIPLEMVGASIALSTEVISIDQNKTREDEIRVYFTVYQNSSLFISKMLVNDSSEDLPPQVNSHVISASVDAIEIDGLVTPIRAAFLPRFKTSNTKCVFWDFSLDDGIGDWSRDGCRLDETIDGRVVCLCDHLTNFAILVDYYEQEVSGFYEVLAVISLIGCIVSIVGLASTIATHLFFKSLRSKVPQKILINLSITLLSLYLVFAIGIKQTGSRHGCITVAVLVHYFGLASIFWMSIEAINMYLMLVKVFYDNIEHFMLKVCVVGYGIPLIIVTVCLCTDVDYYYNTSYCFVPSGSIRNYGFILIVGILLLFNVGAFILIMHKLTCGRNVALSTRGEVSKRLQTSVGLSVLLGLTWVLGFLAIDADSSSRDAFQLLFCVFNSLQGLFIFLFFCVRQKNVRDAWMSCCKERDSRATRSKCAIVSNTGKTNGIQMTSYSSHDTNITSQNNEYNM
ncbi:adhesion G-protein coupled receptor G6-like [Antedon mediterranea]|uniref:adhesion G-protein coupled receptor G6-like n=1 Tax=Antedon mediterranea TaxID=105859 RepID=UPI003AF65787